MSKKYYNLPKLVESSSLSRSAAKRLHEEEDEQIADDFDQISDMSGDDIDTDDDFDGDDLDDADDDIKELDFKDYDDLADDEDFADIDDEDLDADEVDDEVDDVAEPADSDYDCDAIATAVQKVIEKISGIEGLSVKSFVGSIEVAGNKVDFRVKTTDGVITGTTVDNIIPLQQIEDTELALDNINDILSDEPEDDIDIDDEGLDESFGFRF